MTKIVLTFHNEVGLNAKVQRGMFFFSIKTQDITRKTSLCSVVPADIHFFLRLSTLGTLKNEGIFTHFLGLSVSFIQKVENRSFITNNN